MGDLENGLFAGANGSNSKNTSVAYDYVTAMLKGNSSGYASKGGDAQTGTLKVMYDGALPTTSGYNPCTRKAPSSSGSAVTTAKSPSAPSSKEP